jgi:ribonuclease BN (tRNA processing enzyme)
VHSAYVAAKYFLQLPRIPVFAPASVRGHAYYSDAPLDWTDATDGDAIDIGSVRVTFSRTDHGPETLAMRFDGGGRSLGYSADTGPGWSLSALGPGLDLAICEATLDRRDEGRAQHMSARQAGRSGREAGAADLVITHIPPGLVPETLAGDASEAFGSPVEFAREHKEFEA